MWRNIYNEIEFGAVTVLARSVPPYLLFGGVPAKIIKQSK